MQDYSTIIAAVITCIGTIGSVLLGKLILNRKNQCTRDPIVVDTENNYNVYVSLQYLIEFSNCDRAYIMQFHNGGHYVSGKSQKKFSCTHEVCSRGVSKECEKSQNHLVSNFNHYIQEILSNKEYAYVDISKIKDQSFKNLLDYKGVQAIYNIPLRTLEGKVIGILGLDYVKNRPLASFDEMFTEIHSKDELNKFMRNQARTITGYLI